MKHLSLILCLTLTTAVSAQENDILSLNLLLKEYPALTKLIKECQKNNLEIKSAQKYTASAIAQSDAAVANWYPTFWFNSGVHRSNKFTPNQDRSTTSYDNSVNVAQPLWDSEIYYDTKIADSSSEQLKWSQLSIKNQISFNVLATYFSYITKTKDQATYSTIIKNVKKRYKTVEAEVELGKKLKVDLLEVKAKLLEKEYNLVKSVNDAEQTLYLLNLLVNRKIDSKLLKREKIELLKLPSPTKLIDISSRRNPELLIIREREEAENYKYEQVDDEFIPDVYITGSYGFDSEEDVVFSSQEEVSQIGIQLTWEFGDFTRNSRKLAILSEREAINDQKRYLEKQIPNDILTASLELKSLSANLNSLERRITQLAELYRMRQEQYTSGTVSITDLSIAEDDLLEVQLESTEVKSLYNIISMQLWLLAGGENPL